MLWLDESSPRRRHHVCNRSVCTANPSATNVFHADQTGGDNDLRGIREIQPLPQQTGPVTPQRLSEKETRLSRQDVIHDASTFGAAGTSGVGCSAGLCRDTKPESPQRQGRKIRLPRQRVGDDAAGRANRSPRTSPRKGTHLEVDNLPTRTPSTPRCIRKYRTCRRD